MYRNGYGETKDKIAKNGRGEKKRVSFRLFRGAISLRKQYYSYVTLKETLKFPQRAYVYSRRSDPARRCVKDDGLDRARPNVSELEFWVYFGACVFASPVLLSGGLRDDASSHRHTTNGSVDNSTAICLSESRTSTRSFTRVKPKVDYFSISFVRLSSLLNGFSIFQLPRRTCTGRVARFSVHIKLWTARA